MRDAQPQTATDWLGQSSYDSAYLQRRLCEYFNAIHEVLSIYNLARLKEEVESCLAELHKTPILGIARMLFIDRDRSGELASNSIWDALLGIAAEYGLTEASGMDGMLVRPVPESGSYDIRKLLEPVYHLKEGTHYSSAPPELRAAIERMVGEGAAKNVALAPIRHGLMFYGAVVVQTSVDWNDLEAWLLGEFGRLLGHHIHVLRWVHHVAHKDNLTNLYDQDHMRDVIDELIKNKRYPFTVIMLDIDHFKKINDTYGHQVGDEVLKLVAQILVNTSRSSDVVCRYGGEEFAIVMPNAALQEGASLAERIRTTIEQTHSWPPQLEQGVTISAGVATCIPNMSAKQVITAADEALYAAKQAGRNCVKVFVA